MIFYVVCYFVVLRFYVVCFVLFGIVCSVLFERVVRCGRVMRKRKLFSVVREGFVMR